MLVWGRADTGMWELPSKFVLLRFPLSQKTGDVSPHHHMELTKGGRKGDWICKSSPIHAPHGCSLRESYLRFSELNSDSRNLRNWSRPTWSFNTSSKEKPHLLTRCWLGSLLLGRTKI